MIRVCSYCKRILGTKEPEADKGLTHGICERCAWEQSTLPNKRKGQKTMYFMKTYLGRALHYSSINFYPDTHAHQPNLKLGDTFLGELVVGIERVERPNLGWGTAYYLKAEEDMNIPGSLD
jgi:hypothetical protein